MEATQTRISIADALSAIQAVLSQHPSTALPGAHAALAAGRSLHQTLPPTGLGSAATLAHLLDDITPGLNGSKTSAHYYGFVTGGVLPVAEAADRVVSAWDQSVQVHLPEQSVVTVVEARALEMLVQLLRLEGAATGSEAGEAGGDGRQGRWAGKIFTTGATGSNVLGLACGREFVIRQRLRHGRADEGTDDEADAGASVGEMGLVEACRRAGVEKMQVLTTMGHSSLAKAASIVGLGRQSVVDVGREEAPWSFDFEKVEEKLGDARTATIVAVSCGEVNTGRFATTGLEEMKRLRKLCDQHGAWLHVDGAFGLFARALPLTEEFSLLHQGCEGMELADSITGDAHKCLNVPYDCGFFLTRSLSTLTAVCRNPNAAYLTSSSSSGAGADPIPSPLNIALENSRRFRALPPYAVLVAHGRAGLADMFARQVRLARAVAAFVARHAALQLLPAEEGGAAGTTTSTTGIVVLFRAVRDDVNRDLAARINRSCRIMVSATTWQGRPAVRMAVSTWKVDVERDLPVVREVLEGALA